MQNEQFLFQKFDNYSEDWFLDNYKNIPLNISKNLNEKFQIRKYQKEAFARFLYYINDYKKKNLPIHLLFNMATWSGKTFVMAGLILSLYEKWYRNFLFFVNSTNIIDKTKDNFMNSNSSKYLFADKIEFSWEAISIKEVNNFSSTNDANINIKFTTIQWLHSDLTTTKENSLSYEDFSDKKIVIISDEAHHINATTKKWKLWVWEEQEKTSWENTVMNILKSNIDNLLLEFTATLNYSDENISHKYLDKVIYKYDLKNFRLDWYSKEVDILKADMEQSDRILQAIILSQYRLKVAEKNNIFCKPVILFKAQKTIAESEGNLKNFNNLIKKLETSDLENLKKIANTEILKKAFLFFEENNLSLENLVNELKDDFATENCISANDNTDLVSIKLNTLEDINNRIRAVFAVAKLNEWWDVLNLFDIVRLYDSRSNVIDKKSGKIIAWPQTVAEAQLIWRWARYFPFVTSDIWEDKYKRKFDNKNNDLKILETFYYHTTFDNLYITEIRQALKDVWMLDKEEKKDFPLKLKDSFKKSDFYRNWIIYVNSRILKDYSDIDSLEKIWLQTKRIDFKNLFTQAWDDIQAFWEKDNQNSIEKKPATLKINTFDKRIVRKAIQKNVFYRFDNLKKYLWKLKSIDEFIRDKNYLWEIEISFYSTKEILDNLNYEHKFQAVNYLLKYLETEIKDKKVEFIWTIEFKAKSICKYDFEKRIKVDLWENWFSKNEDWFVFENINWTSEEINFIDLFEVKMQELNKKYKDIYLFRNERTIAIYSFENWDRFEPDFLLFMKEKQSDKNITYQIFIEPKWNHLLETDKWKEDFLISIKDKTEILEIEFEKYKLFWLPFYNKERESEFEKVFWENFIK